jgi:hypothetical protein
VLQDNVSHRAKVRAVISMMANLTPTPPASSENKPPTTADQLAGMKPYQNVLFTVPQDLHEGEATAVVIYEGSRSDRYKFNIVNQPPKPRIQARVEAMSLSPRLLPVPPPSEPGKPRLLEFVRGEEKRVIVSPLIDPEAPGAAVLITFKQGSFSREVKANVTRVDP